VKARCGDTLALLDLYELKQVLRAKYKDMTQALRAELKRLVESGL
jgi:hypothetical protein